VAQVDLHEVALAIRCIVENSLEELGGEGAIHIVGQAGEQLYSVEVRDSGKGIEKREEAMREFSTTKAGHIGLGLNMAFRIAKKYGGNLIINAPAEGASVIFEISR
jgi:C4-dicarboxylate-specific signal transduction histidine kinase